DFAAQQVLELMLPAGIKGVLNFAPICLKGPEGCVINNINLVTELENIIYFVNAARQTKEC
ncbi:redox-sensing transcriptional repressor Rex, partial [Planctomycetota bacterium]